MSTQEEQLRTLVDQAATNNELLAAMIDLLHKLPPQDNPALNDEIAELKATIQEQHDKMNAEVNPPTV